jgi:sulfatase modifying factor 1
MDATEVTNEQFSKFIEATNYVTVAERTPRAEDFPARHRRTSSPALSCSLHPVIQSRSTTISSGGRMRRGRTGATRKAPRAASHIGIATRSSRWRTKMRWRTRTRPASGCRPRRSGSLRHEEGSAESSIRGATSSCRVRAPWRIAIKDISLITMREKTASAALGPSPSFSRTPTASTTWPATCGSGSATGIAQTTMPNSRQRCGAQPPGPATPFDPTEPHEKKRVHRGDSFLCTDQYCSRYMVGTRGKGESSTGTNHLGFRLVSPAR